MMKCSLTSVYYSCMSSWHEQLQSLNTDSESWAWTTLTPHTCSIDEDWHPSSLNICLCRELR